MSFERTAGLRDKIKELKKVKRILFICTGNICRSPMAEGFLKKMHSDFSVSSAGISSMDGWNAMPEAIEVMQDYRIDISGHRARQVTEEMVRDADLILAMARHHREMLKNTFQEAEGKIFTLKEYAGTGTDIEDPYGSSKDFYELIAEEILGALKKANFEDL
jgi:protein-tyrosine phosphatase